MSQTLKISEIIVNEQPRKDFSSVDSLAESIGANGLLQPIAVRPDPSGKWVLVDGERRLRAFKKLKREEIPVYVLNELNTHETQVAQMIANLERADLAYIERARGFAALLVDAPAKYNEKVIANKFGLKEKEVCHMIAIAGKIDPSCDIALASGRFDEDNFENLAAIPKEYQKSVADEILRKGTNVRIEIQRQTEELLFDGVFGKSKAEAAGKIHYKTSWGECRTFDKAYAAQVRKEYEARSKKEVAKEKKNEQLSVAQVEKKKEQRAENKVKVAKVLADMKATLPKYLSRKPRPEEIKALREQAVQDIMTDDARALLRAWGVEFKSDIDSTKLKKLVMQHVIEPLVKTDSQAVMLYTWVRIVHGFTKVNDASGFRNWLQKMKA